METTFATTSTTSTTTNNGNLNTSYIPLITALEPFLPSEASQRIHLVKDFLESERLYLKNLEYIQNYAVTLNQPGVLPQDTLLSSVTNLIDVHQQFLIGLESTSGFQPWSTQRWGNHFVLFESDFRVYDDYGTALATASIAIPRPTDSRSMIMQGVIPQHLLPPMTRMKEYIKFLQDTLRLSPPSEYPHRDELIKGMASCRRISSKTQLCYRRSKNVITAKHLSTRIRDWKGLQIHQLGKLLLDDMFIVKMPTNHSSSRNSSSVENRYEVFLFEKIILCCKDERASASGSGDRMVMSWVMVNEPSKEEIEEREKEVTKTMEKLCGSVPGSIPKSKTTRSALNPLVLKGRIFTDDIKQIVAKASGGRFEMTIWWGFAVPTTDSPRSSGSSVLERDIPRPQMNQFTLICREEEQLKMWEQEIKRLRPVEDDWNPNPRPI